MRKNRIRLTEAQLHRVIKESVKKVLREMDDDYYDYDEHFDDEFTDEYLDMICSDFGEGEVVVNGILGLWDGKHAMRPFESQDIKTAITKCVEGSDGEIISTEDLTLEEDDQIHLTVYHHDGNNQFIISKK